MEINRGDIRGFASHHRRVPNTHGTVPIYKLFACARIED